MAAEHQRQSSTSSALAPSQSEARGRLSIAIERPASVSPTQPALEVFASLPTEQDQRGRPRTRTRTPPKKKKHRYAYEVHDKDIVALKERMMLANNGVSIEWDGNQEILGVDPLSTKGHTFHSKHSQRRSTLTGAQLSYRKIERRVFRLLPKSRILRMVFTVLMFATGVWYIARVRAANMDMMIGVPSFGEFLPVEAGPRKAALRHAVPPVLFRDNLLADEKYITVFHYGGFTNQLMQVVKLLYLAKKLDRIAVLPDIAPWGPHGTTDLVPFSQFFDYAAFTAATNVSVVDWRDVKVSKTQLNRGRAGDVPSEEKLSCWGPHDAGHQPLWDYGIQTTFWDIPAALSLPQWELSMLLPSIEVLLGVNQRPHLNFVADTKFKDMDPKPDMPDEQMLCFESLFYTRSLIYKHGEVRQSAIEEFSPDDPVWLDVGRHLRFSPEISRLTDQMLVHLINGRPDQPFIGVHMRRGDFLEGRLESDSLTPYFAGVNKVQAALRKKAANNPSRMHWRSSDKERLPVIFATDETNPDVLGRLQARGWIYLNHTSFGTVQKASSHSDWYANIIDGAMMAKSVGFVGTKSSTWSYIAARRSESWHDGITTIVGEVA